MKRATFHEEADGEVIETARYYETKAPGLGLSFLLDVDTAIQDVCSHPEAYQVVAGEIRHRILRRFPYSLLYVVEPTRVRVLAVAHQRRRPGYWRRRM